MYKISDEASSTMGLLGGRYVADHMFTGGIYVPKDTADKRHIIYYYQNNTIP